jgi:hypothetical protein
LASYFKQKSWRELLNAFKFDKNYKIFNLFSSIEFDENFFNVHFFEMSSCLIYSCVALFEKLILFNKIWVQLECGHVHHHENYIVTYFCMFHYLTSVFHKKNIIQLECVSKAYIKDLMYLKRNTKFLPDRWGLKTSPASQSSLNEIVFRSHESLVKSFRKVDLKKKSGYAFFRPKVNEFFT